MSITVTAYPDASPPRIAIAVSSPDGSPITAVTLARTVHGSSEPVRVQPASGPSPRLVNEYEAEWGTPVVFTATVTSGAGTQALTSAPVVLDPSLPWLIHPTTPALSRALDAGSFAAMGVVSQGAVSRPSTTTAHDVIGSKYRTVTKTGPRAASRTSLSVATVTADEQQAMWALVEDQTPLLIRVPSSWEWDWEDGYYDVGQVDAERTYQYGPERRRVFQLPLERVEAPAGTQQAERTCADVLVAFASITAMVAAYATCTDLLTDTRR